MKKWFILLLTMLLLTGCAREQVPVSRPHSLQVSCGSEAVFAQTCGYQWIWREGRDTSSAMTDEVDGRSSLQSVPYLNAGQAGTIQLTFAQAPTKLMVEDYSSADGYAASTQAEVTEYTFPAPQDGNEHLFVVTAVWTESRDADSWGSCTYHFRYVTEGDVIQSRPELPTYSSLDVYELIQLDASQLMGVEFLNNIDGTSKTCRSQADKTAILDFLKNNLSTDFQTVSAAPEIDYLLRVVCIDGTQLTIGYGGGCVIIGGTPYEAGAMDLAQLWQQLEAGTVSMEAAEAGRHYLNTAAQLPELGDSYVYGEILVLEGSAVTYDELRWVDDDAAPQGYRLEPGWKGQTKTLAADCQLWIYDEDVALYGQVSAEQLLEWAAPEGELPPFCLYTDGEQVSAICEVFVP